VTPADPFLLAIPETSQTLDALIRATTRQMLIIALEAEVEAYIEQHTHLRDENGHALVVRNGKAANAGGLLRRRQFENPCAAGAR
jgi:hypothetical protein